MLATRRLVLTALHPVGFFQCGDGRNAPVHATRVEWLGVISLVGNCDLDLEPARLCSVDQRKRDVLLGFPRGFDCPREREVVLLGAVSQLLEFVPSRLGCGSLRMCAG
jgi:hypothetical protein